MNPYDEDFFVIINTETNKYVALDHISGGYPPYDVDSLFDAQRFFSAASAKNYYMVGFDSDWHRTHAVHRVEALYQLTKIKV